MSVVRDRAAWVRLLVLPLALLTGLAWGGAYLHREWQSIWHQQAKVIGGAQYAPVDPALARDPDVQAAKLKVIGPLASKMQEAVTDQNTSDAPADALANLEAADGVQKPTSDSPATPSPAASTGSGKTGGWQHLPPFRLFHGRMAISGYRDLQFEVPAHASFPRILGTYRQVGHAPARGASLLVLSDEQFRDFIGGNLSDAVYSSDGGSGAVDLALRPTRFEAEKYHLVLTAPARRTLSVEADFRVSFESQ